MRNRNNSQKWLYIGIIVLLISLVLVYVIYFMLNDGTSNKEEEKYDASLYFNEFVITNKEAEMYVKENGQYKKVGTIGNEVELSLNEMTSNEEEYFNIKEFDGNYYIYYKDVNKIDGLEDIDDRYKVYIVFNSNAVTEGNTNFYDEGGNLIYSIDEGYSLPIIIKEDEMYGVEFNNRLLYIKKDECEVVDSHNTDYNNSSGVGVLNYHFFYDENNSEDSSGCREEICVSKAQLTRELDFLDENGIITVMSRELEMYIDGKLQLPKSVYITIDDGGRNQVGLELFTEREEYATVFLITDWYDPSTYYHSKYIELHSHGDNIHEQYRCNVGRQGGAIQCEDREKLLADLSLSRKKLGGSTVFAYPFYEYNDYAISILKEAGFTMAFAGESSYSDNLVKVGMNKYTLPRFVMVNYTTINDLRRYFGNIR